MRKMLISFKPEVFKALASGEKIYEHRRVFPDEPIMAYIYVSRPIQAIAGIVVLDNKNDLRDWRSRFSYDLAAVSRIDEYLKHHRVVMEIRRFQATNQIPLSDLRTVFPNFLIPQMYYYLDGTPLLEYLEEHIYPIGDPITHTFDNITSNMICIH